MVDLRMRHRITIEEAEKKISLLKKKFPTNYSEQTEFFKAMAAIRIAQDRIRSYDMMIKRGVKF